MLRAILFPVGRVACALAALAPATAWAATGDIGCIEAKLGAAAIQRIGDGVVAAADTGGDPARSLDADRDMLIAARDDCKRANGWSVAATDAAISFTQARAVQAGVVRTLTSAGIDPDVAAAAYRMLPTADRRSFIGGMSPAARRAVDALVAARGYRPSAKRHIIMLFSALSGVEYYPGEFAIS